MQVHMIVNRTYCTNNIFTIEGFTVYHVHHTKADVQQSTLLPMVLEKEDKTDDILVRTVSAQDERLKSSSSAQAGDLLQM